MPFLPVVSSVLAAAVALTASVVAPPSPGSAPTDVVGQSRAVATTNAATSTSPVLITIPGIGPLTADTQPGKYRFLKKRTVNQWFPRGRWVRLDVGTYRDMWREPRTSIAHGLQTHIKVPRGASIPASVRIRWCREDRSPRDCTGTDMRAWPTKTRYMTMTSWHVFAGSGRTAVYVKVSGSGRAMSGFRVVKAVDMAVPDAGCLAPSNLLS